MTVGDVTIDRPSVRRSWRDCGYGEFWIQLRTGEGTEEAFFAAVEEANDHEGDEGGLRRFPRVRHAGYVLQVRHLVDDDHLDAWLEDLAARLTRLGFRERCKGSARRAGRHG